jgi:hypothetical protein
LAARPFRFQGASFSTPNARLPTAGALARTTSETPFMKKIATLLCAVLLAGCAGTQKPTTDECIETREKYEALMQRLQQGNVLSPEDVERGRLWADILTLSCGWISTRTEIQGVPVVQPPQ